MFCATPPFCDWCAGSLLLDSIIIAVTPISSIKELNGARVGALALEPALEQMFRGSLALAQVWLDKIWPGLVSTYPVLVGRNYQN